MFSSGIAAPARHRVVVLSLPGVLPLELGIAAQIFSMDPNYELTVAFCLASCTGGPLSVLRHRLRRP